MKRIWILVYTHRGFIEPPVMFFSKKDAEIRMSELIRDNFNKDYDEIEIFEKRIKYKL